MRLCRWRYWLKNPPANAGRPQRPRFNPWVKKMPWRRKWQPTPVLLLGGFHGQRGLAGCSPWGRGESDTTGHLSTRHICGCSAGLPVISSSSILFPTTATAQTQAGQIISPLRASVSWTVKWG